MLLKPSLARLVGKRRLQRWSTVHNHYFFGSANRYKAQRNTINADGPTSAHGSDTKAEDEASETDGLANSGRHNSRHRQRFADEIEMYPYAYLRKHHPSFDRCLQREGEVLWSPGKTITASSWLH